MAEPVTLEVDRSGTTGTAVGFLEGTGVNQADPDATFETGETPAGLVEALRAHGEHRVAAKRGFYRCFVCDEPENEPTSDWGAFGTGPFEIHLWTDKGDLFVAPNLIVHLVEKHGFLPPPEFVEAALHVAEFRWRLQRGPVAETMHQVTMAQNAATDPGPFLDHLLSILPGTSWFVATGPDSSGDFREGFLQVALSHFPGRAKFEETPTDWNVIQSQLELDESMTGIRFTAAVDVAVERRQLT